jgi:cytochrome c-type biogenesis protein CcmH
MNSNSADTYPFDSNTEARVFKNLTQSLRCVVCQNQTLAESYAPKAIELRNIIYSRVQQNESEDSILASVIQEYGPFVAYKPPLNLLTGTLWFGPALMLIASLWVVYRRTKR